MRVRDKSAVVPQLCSLGLDEHQFVPYLVHEIENLIPSNCIYCWLDGTSAEIDYIYSPRKTAYDLLPAYLEYYGYQKAPEVFHGMSHGTRYRTAFDYDRLFKVDKNTLTKHSLYNEIMKPFGIYSGCVRTIYADYRPVGAIHIYRDKHEKKFRQSDIIELEKVGRHVEYALSISSFSKNPVDEKRVWNSELLIIDKRGKLLSMSKGADEMLRYLDGRESVSMIMKSIAQSAISVSVAKEASLPPVKSIKTRWGHFKFTGYAMNPTEDSIERISIAVSVEHFLPSKLYVLHRLQRSQLTNRQIEVCLHLSDGKTYDQVARQLGVAKSTIISHKKDIFNRLEIETRSQLNERISYGPLRIDG